MEKKSCSVIIKPLPLLAIAVLIAAVLLNFFWIVVPNIAPSAYPATMGLQYYASLSQSGFPGFNSCFSNQRYYPPLEPLLLALGFYILGPGELTPTVIYSIILIIIFLMAWKLAALDYGPSAGWLAAFMIITNPGILEASRSGAMEFLLTAISAITMYFFLLSDHFQRRKYSIITGIFFGFGLLTKWTFLAYVGGFFILSLITRTFLYMLKPENKKQILMMLKNFALFTIFMALVAGPWYFKYFNYKYFFVSIGNDPNSATGLLRFGFYASVLKNALASKPYFYLFLLALPMLPILRRVKESYKLFLAQLAVSYFIFSMMPPLDGRYIVPLIVPVICIASAGISAIVLLPIRRLFIIIVICFGIINLYESIFAIPSASISVGKISPQNLFQKNPWGQIIRLINKSSDKKKLSIAAFPLNDAESYDAYAENLRYKIQLDHLNKKNMKIELEGFDALYFWDFDAKVKKIDFLLVTEDIFSQDAKFEIWFTVLRTFKRETGDDNIPENTCQDIACYRKLIAENFIFLQKFSSNWGSDILVFKNRELIY